MESKLSTYNNQLYRRKDSQEIKRRLMLLVDENAYMITFNSFLQGKLSKPVFDQVMKKILSKPGALELHNLLLKSILFNANFSTVAPRPKKNTSAGQGFNFPPNCIRRQRESDDDSMEYMAEEELYRYLGSSSSTGSPIASPMSSSIASPIMSPIASPMSSSIASPIMSPMPSSMASPIMSPMPSSMASPTPFSIASPIVSQITPPIPASIATPIITTNVSSILSSILSSIETPIITTNVSSIQSSIETPIITTNVSSIPSSIETPIITTNVSIPSSIETPIITTNVSSIPSSIETPIITTNVSIPSSIETPIITTNVSIPSPIETPIITTNVSIPSPIETPIITTNVSIPSSITTPIVSPKMIPMLPTIQTSISPLSLSSQPPESYIGHIKPYETEKIVEYFEKPVDPSIYKKVLRKDKSEDNRPFYHYSDFSYSAIISRIKDKLLEKGITGIDKDAGSKLYDVIFSFVTMIIYNLLRIKRFIYISDNEVYDVMPSQNQLENENLPDYIDFPFTLDLLENVPMFSAYVKPNISTKYRELLNRLYQAC
ncbi:hypothetical protein M9Y10_026502 [Tritrichomonas musculus]|uniref:Uncharacterized protein n=1 Tax=Tritrichomonas musculus TaxID=1915356 RepID=A0ABR2H8U5_9EUKA